MPRAPQDDATRTDETIRGAIDGAAPLALRVVHSPDAGAVGRLFPARDGLRLGRRTEGEGDVTLADSKLSRNHVILRRHGESNLAGLEDLGSKNGTFVDGQRVRRRGLERGAVVRIGGTLLLAVDVEEGAAFEPGPHVGASGAWRAMCGLLDRVAPSGLGVLLVGETGAGKEIAAARLHRLSRRAGPLVAVNCAAVPAGLAESAFFGVEKGAFTGAVASGRGHFEAAGGGTLLLDEVGEIAPALQAKLLRVLETGDYYRVGSARPRRADARVVAATNRDLEAEVAAGRFRRDLYARLAGVVIRVPPLRERREDIPPLAARFLGHSRHSAGFLEALMLHDWPMNVRELKALCERLAIVVDAPRLERAHLPPGLGDGRGARPPAATSPAAGAPAGPPDRGALESLLRLHGGNVSQLAAHFGRDRKQVYRWLRRAGLRAEDYRS